ncbi:hypothetical protein [Archangium sp. Cb G35]|uniref:hypothetical protein n=1 Tax=Archangium sp. Cb G35 TaxID=1920190 RepID=UPI001300F73D|nr:hypothetical protein [Archangium sp. Cb G35]
MSVRVKSSKQHEIRVEVTAELFPGAHIPSLQVRELTSVQDDDPRTLNKIKIERVGVNSAQCSISVEDEEPGTYEGPIFEPDAYQPMTFEPVSPKVSGFVRVRLSKVPDTASATEKKKAPDVGPETT